MKAALVLVTTLLALGAAPRSPLLPSAGAMHPLIEPPFVRKWTHLAGDSTALVAVRDNVVYYRSQREIGALDLATGALRWRQASTGQVIGATLQGQAIYALVQAEEKSTLLAIDLPSRRQRIVARLSTQGGRLAADAARVYVLDASGMLRAYDPRSGALSWAHPLGPEPRWNHGAQLLATGDGLYVGIEGVGEFGVGSKDGRLLWSRPSEHTGHYQPLRIGGDVITRHKGLSRVQVRSGKVVWKTDQGSSHAVLAGRVLVDNSATGSLGRDVDSGRLLWRLPLRDPETWYGGDKATITDGENVWIFRNPMVSVTKGGREQWTRSEPFTGAPVYADHRRAVTIDRARILGYAPGTLPPLPTSLPRKRALAERLVSRFELLDNAERAQLPKLVPFVFRPLLARYVAWANADVAVAKHGTGKSHYSLLTAVEPILHATARREDTGAIMTALSKLGGWQEPLERILQHKGDPRRFVPVFVRSLRRLPPEKQEETAVLDAVSHSSHPQAVAFMLQVLRDPKASVAWRQEAFSHLPGIGGARGLETVRRARPARAARKPWFERVDLAAHARSAEQMTRNDSRGRTWMLFQSVVLGNWSDLFVVEKTASGWGRPLFTGAWTDGNLTRRSPTRFRGIPITQLRSTEWIRIFPDDPTIREDTDGDGLTNVVEARLRTDPGKADMDGDGMGDAVDPCPNAAPRPLGDAEKIVAACVEARFFLQDWDAPAVLNVKDVQPFGLYGYSSILLWPDDSRKQGQSGIYGDGIHSIGIYSPDLRSGRASRTKGRGGEVRHRACDPDGKTARTSIYSYSGGVDGDSMEVKLKKVGGEWFVVDMEMHEVP